MTDLSAQKRLASDVLDVGKDRVWFDPEAQSEIADAITREDIRDLVDEGTIQQKGSSNNSRGRARERADKQAYGHRTGAGTRRNGSRGDVDGQGDTVHLDEQRDDERAVHAQRGRLPVHPPPKARRERDGERPEHSDVQRDQRPVTLNYIHLVGHEKHDVSGKRGQQ
mgnify:CR=1 FL=1